MSDTTPEVKPIFDTQALLVYRLEVTLPFKSLNYEELLNQATRKAKYTTQRVNRTKPQFKQPTEIHLNWEPGLIGAPDVEVPGMIDEAGKASDVIATVRGEDGKLRAWTKDDLKARGTSEIVDMLRDLLWSDDMKKFLGKDVGEKHIVGVDPGVSDEGVMMSVEAPGLHLVKTDARGRIKQDIDED